MALTYGYAFGVELTVDNVISQYMFDQVRTRGAAAAIVLTSSA
jgi:hypothetical protein